MTTVLKPATSGLPIYFMGGTVLSFNCSIGYGSQQESVLNIEIIEDCNAFISGSYIRQNIITSGIIGSPQYFTAGNFTFGGIVTSWNRSKNTNGNIYTIKLTDPRSLLQNVTIITDSLRGETSPYRTTGSVSFWDTELIYGRNYYNVYAWYEDRLRIVNGVSDRCSGFGDSGNIDGQGMPYARIQYALIPRPISSGGVTAGPPVLGPLGAFPYSMFESPEYSGTPIVSASGTDGIEGGSLYNFEVDLKSLPSAPDYYRIPGPSVTLLEMAEGICDVTGNDFFVYMEKVDDSGIAKNMIRFGLVDLKNEPSSFSTIQTAFSGEALDLSFGQELRTDITRSMLIGENIHELVYVNEFLPFFGEDIDPNTLRLRPVIAFEFDNNGFWIAKNVNDLNLKLYDPFFINDALYSIHELDIRCAMASFKAWFFRAFDNNVPGSFNASVRNRFANCVINNPNWIKNRLVNSENEIGVTQANLYQSVQDLFQNPNPSSYASNRPDNLIDLEKIHSWLAELGNNYYGKAYIVSAPQVCYRTITDGSVVFTKEPTNAGGWLAGDNAIPFVPTVLDLADPELDTFRNDDGRIKCFAVFKTDGEVANAGANPAI
jgi:hypothetical protein